MQPSTIYKLVCIFFLVLFLSLVVVLFKRPWFCENRSCGHFQFIERYRDVRNIFESCDEHTLITFDVDDTLITATDVMVARYCDCPFWFKLRVAFKYPSLAFNQKTFEWFVSVACQSSDHFFVFDPDIVYYIRQLRKHGSNVVALTSMKSGSFGIINNMPEWRASMLQRFGIDLRGKFSDTSFTMLPKYRGDYPCLYKGILCANQQPKGEVLRAFLDSYHLEPTRIISFDDDACALDSIARECTKCGFTFTGYQVLGAKKLAGVWNSHRAFLQLDYVMKHGRWLSDKQADALLAEKSVV